MIGESTPLHAVDLRDERNVEEFLDTLRREGWIIREGEVTCPDCQERSTTSWSEGVWI